MSWQLFLRTWRAQRLKLLAVAIALTIWGSLMPIIYEAFKEQIQVLLGTGAIPDAFVQFGGGDLFTLAGTIALGFIHPIAVALTLVFALGFAVASVAGERQRGTLEVLLARPLSRRRSKPIRSPSISPRSSNGTSSAARPRRHPRSRAQPADPRRSYKSGSR